MILRNRASDKANLGQNVTTTSGTTEKAFGGKGGRLSFSTLIKGCLTLCLIQSWRGGGRGHGYCKRNVSLRHEGDQGCSVWLSGGQVSDDTGYP